MTKLGLVLAGGGGKGSYEIGVWKYLREIGLDSRISVIAGTSVGGLNAFLIANGNYDLAEKLWLTQIEDKILDTESDSHRGGAVFSREGLLQIINENFPFCSMNELPKIYVTCYNTNDNKGIINTKIENTNDILIDRDIFKENKFYQQLNKITGNFKLFRTNVGHNGPFRKDENEQFFLLLLKSTIEVAPISSIPNTKNKGQIALFTLLPQYSQKTLLLSISRLHFGHLFIYNKQPWCFVIHNP